MKATHLTAYGHLAQNLLAVEVCETNAPSAREGLVLVDYGSYSACALSVRL